MDYIEYLSQLPAPIHLISQEVFSLSPLSTVSDRIRPAAERGQKGGDLLKSPAARDLEKKRDSGALWCRDCSL